MKITENRTEVRKVVVRTICDSCGRGFEEVLAAEPALDGYKRRDETVLRHDRTEQSIYEITGTSHHLDVDLCAACTRDKLVPFLRSIGVTREYEEVEW